MTLQEICDIATRHCTLIAHRTVVACVQRAYRTGEPLEVGADAMREAFQEPARTTVLVDEDGAPLWRRLVERNSDTRWTHV